MINKPLKMLEKTWLQAEVQILELLKHSNSNQPCNKEMAAKVNQANASVQSNSKLHQQFSKLLHANNNGNTIKTKRILLISICTIRTSKQSDEKVAFHKFYRCIKRFRVSTEPARTKNVKICVNVSSTNCILLTLTRGGIANFCMIVFFWGLLIIS